MPTWYTKISGRAYGYGYTVVTNTATGKVYWSVLSLGHEIGGGKSANSDAAIRAARRTAKREMEG